ncbi:MAG: acylphosphatase [Acidimicrobiia bacterium]|nr:acylphosphatase [Acidimicrobiia bacterium]
MLIAGRVQGVSFRDRCRFEADGHGIGGWVRDIPTVGSKRSSKETSRRWPASSTGAGANTTPAGSPTSRSTTRPHR